MFLGESSLIADRLLSDVIMDMSRSITDETLKAEIEQVLEEKRRKAEEARRMKEWEQLLFNISKSECDCLFKQVLQEDIHKIANEELQKAMEEDHNERVSRCSQHLNDQYVDQFVESEMCHIAMETLHEMQLCKKYFQRWREELASRKKLRRQMRGFPAAPGLMGHGGTLKALVPSAMHNLHNQSKGIVDLGHAGKILVSLISPQQRTEQLLHEMKVQQYFQELLCDAAWTPMELPSLIAKTLPLWKNCIFCKVVLALPEINERDDVNSDLSEWLKAKFCWAGVQSQVNRKRVHTLALYNTLEYQEDWPVSVNVCVKAVHGSVTQTEYERVENKNELWGTNSFVMLLPYESEPSEWYWISAVLQLKQLLSAKPFKPAPNLLVLFPGTCPDAEQNVSYELDLQKLVSRDLISDYAVVSIPETVTNLKGADLVTSAVQSLLSRCPRTPRLHALPFRQYIEDGVYHAFTDPFYYDMARRRKHGLPSQDPAAIIDLYNCAIALMAEAVSAAKFGDLSWPITEFSSSRGNFVMPPMEWNNLEHLAWLKKAVLSFQIPQMDKPPEGAPWHPVCAMIKDYVSWIPIDSKSLSVLDSEVQMLLDDLWKHCLDERGNEGSSSEASVQEVPWDDLIALCINHKLRDWGPPLNAPIKAITEDLYVYFLENDLENFRMPETWSKACLNTDKEILTTAKRSPLRRKSTLHPSKSTLSFSKTQAWKDDENLKSFHFHPTKRLLSENQEDESSPSKRSMYTLQHSQAPEDSFAVFQEKTQNDIDELKSLQARLDRSILAEKEESERFNRRLQELLVEDLPDVSLSLPMYLPNACLRGALESATIVRNAEKSSDSTILTLSKPDPQEKSATSKSPSVKELLDSLRMNIKRYRDEDAIINLHYSTLLAVGEPDNVTTQD